MCVYKFDWGKGRPRISVQDGKYIQTSEKKAALNFVGEVAMVMSMAMSQGVDDSGEI